MCVYHLYCVHWPDFSVDRLWSMSCSMRLVSPNVSFTPGVPAPPTLRILKQVSCLLLLFGTSFTMFQYQNLNVFASKLFFLLFSFMEKSEWKTVITNQRIYLTAQCSPRGKVTHSDATGQTRIYTPSITWALQRHLVSSEPELGGPLENQVNTGPRLSHTDKLPRQYLHVAACSGCASGQSVVPLGVPDPAGLHHDGHAGRPSHSQGGCNHPGCPAGHWLVHRQPDQVAESRLGTGWVVLSSRQHQPTPRHYQDQRGSRPDQDICGSRPRQDQDCRCRRKVTAKQK